MAKNKLFSDFPPVSDEQWKEKIFEDLKGADYEKKLIWKTIEGIDVAPFYRINDIKELDQIRSLPGEFPFVRGKSSKNNNWKINQRITEQEPAKANTEATDAIEKGAEAIEFNASSVKEKDQLRALIKGINLEKTAVGFTRIPDYSSFLEQFTGVISENGFNKEKIEGSLNFDPLSHLIIHERFPDSQDKSFTEAASLIEKSRTGLPSYKIIAVNGSDYHEAGASIVQEVAFALAQGNEYLAQIAGMDMAIDNIAPRLQFTLSVGSSYFMEIAKFRAIKMLWANIVKQYNPASDNTCQPYINAITSTRNKTIYDPYVNILRSSTEAMAAAIGSADTITVNPFDGIFKEPDDFSKRVARNQQLVLKHEAYFNKVVDPAAGSYYVEKLTDAISSEAWELFKKMENEGGFIKVSGSGFIVKEIENTRQKRDMDIAMRKRVLVGTNQYSNPQETMIEKVDLETSSHVGKGNLKPYRGAQPFEEIRMETEKQRKKGASVPKVFLFTYGNPAIRKARANFTMNFFGCAGYEIIDNLGFKTIEQGVEKAVKSGAEIIVLCSSDQEYEQLEKAAKQIKEKNENTAVIVAGYPKDIISKLQEAGVDDFIHIKSNIIEVLKNYNKFLLKNFKKQC